MSKLSDFRNRRIYFKNRARHEMYRDGNLFKTVFASLLSVAVTEGAAGVIRVLRLLLRMSESELLIALETAVVILFSVPLAFGFVRMTFKMSSGERTEFSELFFAFGRKNIKSVCKLTLSILPSAALLFVLSFAAGRLAAYAYEGIRAQLFSETALLLTAFFAPFFSGMFGKVFLLPMAFFMTGDISSARLKADRCSKNAALEISAFNASFIPLALLVPLSFGIIFFVYLLPLYMLSYGIFSAYLLAE